MLTETKVGKTIKNVRNTTLMKGKSNTEDDHDPYLVMKKDLVNSFGLVSY